MSNMERNNLREIPLTLTHCLKRESIAMLIVSHTGMFVNKLSTSKLAMTISLELYGAIRVGEKV